MDINNPIPREWEQYVTQTALGLEVIPDHLYDTATYVDNTTINLPMFNTVRANKSLSNMTQPSVLPNPESFLIQAVRLDFQTRLETIDQGAAAAALPSRMDDILLLQNTGRFTLTIGHKQYGPWLLWPMPAGSGMMGFAGAAGAEAANLVSGYGRTFGKLYALFPNLMIAPLQNFQVDLDWPAAVNLSGDMVIQCLFDGQRARAIG